MEITRKDMNTHACLVVKDTASSCAKPAKKYVHVSCTCFFANACEYDCENLGVYEMPDALRGANCPCSTMPLTLIALWCTIISGWNNADSRIYTQQF